MSPQVSIIIVNYNVKELLLDCIRSIYANVKISFEIIVIDNNSTDGSIALIQQHFPQVKTIVNTYNAGFPKATNQGFLQSKGEYIFMLNPDTVIIKDAIDKMIDFLENNKDVAILAPQLLNTDGTIQYSIQRFITVQEIILETFFLHTIYKNFHSYINKPINTPIAVEAVSGAAILFPRSLIHEIGGLDEDLFWTEDMEFCYRAFKKGKKIYYYPNAKIIHHVGASGTKNRKVMLSRQILTKITFFKKNHSAFAFTLVKYARLLHIISRIFIFKVLSISQNKIFKIKAEAYIFTLSEFNKHNY